MIKHTFQVDETRSGFGECDKCGEASDHNDHDYDDGACLECGAGSDQQCDMNCGTDNDDE